MFIPRLHEFLVVISDSHNRVPYT